METLITTCIIAVLATSIYLYVSKTISNYEKRDTYDNVVDIYKMKSLAEYIKSSTIYDTSLNSISNCSDLTNTSTAIRDNLNITKLIICKDSSSYKSSAQGLTTDVSFKEYIRLLRFTNSDTDVRLIVHFKNNTYASLLMKKKT